MTDLTTVEQFNAVVAEVESGDGYQRPAAYALGLATVAPSGKVLDTAYPVVNVGENFGAAAVLAKIASGPLAHRRITSMGPPSMPPSLCSPPSWATAGRIRTSMPFGWRGLHWTRLRR